MSGHAPLSCSNLRWPLCAGSIREESGYTDVAGAAAIDGTGTHLLLEMCLDNNVPAIQYDMQIIGANHPDRPNGWLVDIERVNRVQMCLDYVTRRVNELQEQFPNATVTVEAESKSNPGALVGRTDWWGTVDITITCRYNHTGIVAFLEVVDYKDGKGWVHARNNSQLESYLIGKVLLYIGKGPTHARPHDLSKVEHCRMTIVQPKTNPVVRYQCSTQAADKLTVGSLIERGGQLGIAAFATDKPDAPVSPGKHCQWCKANPKRGGHCTAAADKSLQVIKDMSDKTIQDTAGMPLFEYVNKVIADPKSLTSSQLAELLSAKDALMPAFDACAEEIKLRIENGERVSGYALGAGRSSRVWSIDEDEVVKKLKGRKLKLDDIYPKKLITVPALMKSDKLTKAQKETIENEYVKVVPGKLSLKKVAHTVAQSSTDVVQSSKEMFADVPATEEPAAEAAPISFL